VITVESGVKEITIYNGADNGQLTFIISFSGAYNAMKSVAALAATITLINLFWALLNQALSNLQRVPQVNLPSAWRRTDGES